MSKRQIKVLTLSDKLKIVNAFENGKTRDEIQTEFGLPKSTFYKIIKSKETIKSQCSEGHGKMKKNRVSDFPDIEDCLLGWIKQIRDKNMTIKRPLLIEKSKDFATKLGIQNFAASNGWLEGFKKRHDIVFNTLPGEKKSIEQGVCDQWTEKLLEGNSIGLTWYPHPYDRVTSAHFIEGKKSDDPLTPNYNPSLLHPFRKTKVVNQLQCLNRHESFMKQRKKIQKLSQTSTARTKLECVVASAKFEQIFMNGVHEEDPLNTELIKSEVIGDDSFEQNIKREVFADTFGTEFEQSFKGEVIADANFNTNFQSVKSELIIDDTFRTEFEQSLESRDIYVDNFSANHEESVNGVTTVKDTFRIKLEQYSKVDKECQVELIVNRSVPAKTFICNRYIYYKTCNVEIQTEIIEPTAHVKIRDNRNLKDKQCNTIQKIFADKSTETDF